MPSTSPFFLYRRSNSPYYYVRFRDSSGKFLSGISTHEQNYSQALKIAWDWFYSGNVSKEKQSQSISAKFLLSKLRESELSESDADKLLKILQEKGILKSYVKTGEDSDVMLSDFLLNFWDWDNSEYINEKRRRGNKIGLAYVKRNIGYSVRYWTPFFPGKVLGSLTRQDLRDFLNFLQGLPQIGNAAKNQIWNVGAEALRWAYNNEILKKDITAGLSGFSQKTKERAILSPELVQALFATEWADERYKLANILAMCTGLRAGEIRALRKCDLGEGCLYINHSWSDLEGLKSTKNGESRRVFLPFPQLSRSLLNLAEKNPFDKSMSAFVFFASVAGQPIQGSMFLNALREALEKVGLEKKEACKYCFHAWRHFYTTYMSEKIPEKLLQSQTGHKTQAMLEHYSEHELSQDSVKIKSAQCDIFGKLVNSVNFDFFEKKIYQNVKTKEMNKSGLYEHGRADRNSNY